MTARYPHAPECRAFVLDDPRKLEFNECSCGATDKNAAFEEGLEEAAKVAERFENWTTARTIRALKDTK